MREENACTDPTMEKPGPPNEKERVLRCARLIVDEADIAAKTTHVLPSVDKHATVDVARALLAAEAELAALREENERLTADIQAIRDDDFRIAVKANAHRQQLAMKLRLDENATWTEIEAAYERLTRERDEARAELAAIKAAREHTSAIIGVDMPSAQDIAAKLVEQEEELARVRELLLDCVLQSCELPSGIIDHQFISAYEAATEYLDAIGDLEKLGHTYQYVLAFRHREARAVLAERARSIASVDSSTRQTTE